MPTQLQSLPILEMGDFIGGSGGDDRQRARLIGEAARTFGFFYLTGHGVPEAVTGGAFAASRAFFALPAARKMALSITQNRNNRGYVSFGEEGLGDDGAPDAKEAFNIGVAPGPDGEDVNSWPQLDGFRSAIIAYRDAMQVLSGRVHRLFALDLGLRPDFFDSYFTHPLSTLRLLRYPPRRAADAADPGAGQHTDYGNVTLLAQDAIGGLEVRTREGVWITAPPVPDALVCNIGDCLMRWSNDVLVSNPHRVVSPAGAERFSIAYFADPNADAEVSCLSGCAGSDNPPRYAPILAGEYLRQRFDATYAYRRGS